ncbi:MULTISPECIES: hypothetical protein [Streptococcus]|uniref:Glycosyltransferase n=1 Tax=Streptococcus caledonicus TaxID=2614158 RepID=A0ABW0UCH1_9STRE|nr:hypothetical protein [Streptococcus sp. S784/96/1]
MVDDLAIVLPIYDGYELMWDDCINLIKKYWKHHPPIFVFTNEIKKEWENVKCFPVGANAEWSKKVQKALEIIDKKYIIILLEDFFIGDFVDNEKIKTLIAFMKSHEIDYAKLVDNNRVIKKSKPKFVEGYPYEVIYQDEEYGVCLQASIWRKKFLFECVGNENYNAWIFELNEVLKTRGRVHEIASNLIEVPDNILHIQHGALQGKMIPKTIKYFEKRGYSLTKGYSIMSRSEYLKWYFKQFGKDVTPQFAIPIVKKIAKKFGYDFVEEKWKK